MSDAEFLGEATADRGNVRVRLTFDDVTISLVGTPSKVRSLADILMNACEEAESQMPDADVDGYCNSCGERHKGEPHA